MTAPEQERVFIAALRAAEAVRRVAREQALVNFVPTDPLNFPLYVAAVTAADSTFKATVIRVFALEPVPGAPRTIG
jgi:hypothetical protein